MPKDIKYVARGWFSPCRALGLGLIVASALCPLAQAATVPPPCPVQPDVPGPQTATGVVTPVPPGQLIVIGFMGGNVSATNLAHREAVVAKDLQEHNPHNVYAAVFANSDSRAALSTVLKLLDINKAGCLSAKEKSSARIVIFGHSWGASEGITLARRLSQLDIPVLLTVQVDSVEKFNENDATIPANVHEAINFYQLEGFLHGRSVITATDPKQTTILGNFQSSYKNNPVTVDGYSWYARAFMRKHIEIENDPVVWGKIEAMIQAKVL